MPAAATILAFDFGLRRIGVAVGQSVTRSASPLGVVANRESGVDHDAIAALVEEDPIPANNSEVETTGVVDDIVHVHSGGFETGDFGDWQVVSGE